MVLLKFNTNRQPVFIVSKGDNTDYFNKITD